LTHEYIDRQQTFADSQERIQMTNPNKFSIAHSEGFPLELGRSPKKVRNAYQRTVIPLLQSVPDQSDPPKIKHLNGYKSLWRLRISDDYRLVYRVDKDDLLVTMLMLDHRNKIYKRLGANEDGTPGIRIVANAEKLLEKNPTPEEIGRAEILSSLLPPTPNTSPERPLPESLDSERLSSWGVPQEFHMMLKSIQSEGELLELSGEIPDIIIERILNGLWPKNIEEVDQEPVRMSIDPVQIEAAASGEQSLESFLLKLDDDQKPFVSKFSVAHPKGPWLLKGGPGSGKSTIALYCIQSLLKKANSELPFENSSLKILFTTFTKSLVNASNYLLKALEAFGDRHILDVKNVDSLAYGTLPHEWKKMKVEFHPRKYILKALSQCYKKNPKLSFSIEDSEFIEQEIEWVIVGQDLNSLDNYLQAKRTGRGRALGQQQRRQIWMIFETFQFLMRNDNVCLFSERLQQAAKSVSPKYDYVFIDEAQDLKPVAIRFCIGLCRDLNNVFLTADTNQSIYGNGLSWSNIADDLQFKGRARILRRNYRTTEQIWEAIKILAPNGEGSDRETLDVETVFQGPYPIVSHYSNINSLSKRINSYLHEALRQERVTLSSAAVLCPTKREQNEAYRIIDKKLKPKIMNSQEVDLGYKGIKILTMHAAKGLQFPVVVVFGVDNGRMPLPVPTGIDTDEYNTKQQRLLFVACSRAMRRLIIFSDGKNSSPFISNISDEHWEIEHI
jgi:superfamily I DNA/RNA helicase/mRNA-degrading endonuclease RelE of RelBE toxin-antitoxin system